MSLLEDTLFSYGENQQRRERLRARGWRVEDRRPTRGGPVSPCWVNPQGKVYTDEGTVFVLLDQIEHDERRAEEARNERLNRDRLD